MQGEEEEEEEEDEEFLFSKELVFLFSKERVSSFEIEMGSGNLKDDGIYSGYWMGI
jgi:hypothetical protein